MRIYDGSPRQDYEEVLRSIGAFLDQREMREILLTEAPDGFIVQGLVGTPAAESQWSDPTLNIEKETYTFLDDDIAVFIDEGIARRKGGAPNPDPRAAGQYEKALRVIGRYIDQQKPRDIFMLEQDGSYIVRLLMGTRAGARHVLAEFTAEELDALVSAGPNWRGAPANPSGQGRPSGGSSGAGATS
jgi:hypothetical protein